MADMQNLPLSGSGKKLRLKLSVSSSNLMDLTPWFVVGRAWEVGKNNGWSQMKLDQFLNESSKSTFENMMAVVSKYFDVEN